MTAISASRRKTINRVLEVSALAVQAYAIMELNELEPWRQDSQGKKQMLGQEDARPRSLGQAVVVEKTFCTGNTRN